MDKNKLKQLFEYQKFANNEHLNSVIHKTLETEAVELTDESLLALSGGLSSEEQRKIEEDNKKLK